MVCFLNIYRRRRARLVLSLLALCLTACDTVSLPNVPAELARTPAALQPNSTPQPAAAPSPESTPLPAPDLLAQALERRAIGDYEAAATDFHTLLTAHPSAPEVRTARFYLAESFALRRRWTSAVDALQNFIAEGPQDDLHQRALFLLARGQEEAGAWADAVATYERYRAPKTPLEPYARLRQAAQQQALGQLDQAAGHYEAVAAGDIVRGERAGAYEKAIALRRQLGQNDIALRLYGELLGLADLPDYRARILAEAAALAEQQGAPDQARAWRREIAARAPAMPQALDAVGLLLADPQGGLDPAAAARVYTLHEQWAAALPQFDAAITLTDTAALDLRRERALARRATGDFEGALAELAAVGAEAPASPVGRQSQLDWIQTKGQSGDTAGAIDSYREFAQSYPDDPRAPEALMRAAILLGRQGDAEGATQQQLDLGRRFPASEQAHDALYEAGWYFFRAGQSAEALDAWDLLRRSSSGVVAAQAAFWAARAASPDNEAYDELLNAAFSAAPDSYYGARAAELLGAESEGSVPPGAPVAAELWRTAEDWIAIWSGAPAYYLNERGYPPEVAQAGPIVRAIELGEVGLQPEAIAEWNAAMEVWREDPVKLYLLARLADQHGVPYIALRAAEVLTRRSPDKGFANAPEALRRLIFPTPYGAAIQAQAAERGLDPRALYAMLRQESLFNPGATSWVGARGLGQVMPATAQGIAQNLQVPDFDEADLYRPVVSIRFGAFYLGYQVNMMEGSLLGGLAAYNGGPGNAQRWAGGTAVTDPDLFAEGIDYQETRGYVKLVYGYYGAYRRLYKRP